MTTLILMVGIPASGKSTYTKMKLSPKYKILSSDAIRKELFEDESDQMHNEIVFQTLYERARNLLVSGKDVVIDATNNNANIRKKALSHFEDLNIKRKAIVIETPINECIKRDNERKRHVGENVISNFSNSFEYPTKSEGFDDIICIKSTKNGFVRTLTTTLLFILKDNKILLAQKKRGFGAGLYNGVGGKVEIGETIADGVIRETKEELNITPLNIQKRAEIDFDEYVNGEHAIVNMHIFTATDFEGEPQESNEVSPTWFDISKIPYSKMFPDDYFWLPEILKGNNVTGFFKYDINLNILEKKINTTTNPLD